MTQGPMSTTLAEHPMSQHRDHYQAGGEKGRLGRSSIPAVQVKGCGLPDPKGMGGAGVGRVFQLQGLEGLPKACSAT